MAVSAPILCIFIAVLAWALWPSPSAHSKRLYNKALVFERQGNDALALETLRQALTINPSNKPASLRAAWILYQDDRDEEARGFLGQVLPVGKAPSDPITLKAAALIAMVTGDDDTAENLLTSVSQENPRDIEALEWIVQNETDRNQLDEALKHVSQCLELDGSYPLCHYQRVELLIRKNDFEQARRAFKDALQATHGYPWLHKLGGYIELGSINPDAAEAEFRILEKAGRQLANEVYFRASQDGLVQIALFREDFPKAHDLIEGAISASSSASEKAQYRLDLVVIGFLANKPVDTSPIEQEVSIDKSDDQTNSAIRVLAFADQIKEALGLIPQVKDTAALGTRFAATRSFLDGVDLFHSGDDVSSAVDRIQEAYGEDPDPMFLFTILQAQISNHDCIGAKKTLDRLLNQQGVILLDSYAAFLPVAQRNLKACIPKESGRATRSMSEFGDRLRPPHLVDQLHNSSLAMNFRQYHQASPSSALNADHQECPSRSLGNQSRRPNGKVQDNLWERICVSRKT